MNKNYNIAFAKALIFLRPNHPAGHAILAKAFAKEKVLDRALECWTEARSRFPDQERIVRGRMRILKALHRFDEAITEAEHLIALKPDDASGYVYRAKMLMNQERFDRALESWLEARRRFPHNHDIIQGQIRALQELGRFEEGLREAEQLIDSDPKQPLGYICAAELLTEQGRFPEALEQWDRAGRLFPGHPRVSQGRCCALRELGRHDEALIEADRLIARYPKDPTGYVEHFDTLYRASFYGEAYTFILAQLGRLGPTRAILNRFVNAAIVMKGKKFTRRVCYHLLRTNPRDSSSLLVRYLVLSAETGYLRGIASANSAFPHLAPIANDKINLILAMFHASNLDMYKALDFLIKHSEKKHSLFTVSQIVVMSAVLGDRLHARKGLTALQSYQEVYHLGEDRPIFSNVRMHQRFNIVSDELETVMAELSSLMKEEKYDRVFDRASDYVGKHRTETSLCCVYLIAALKSGAYEFQPGDTGPENRMVFFWDNAEVPRPIRDLIDANKKNNPDLECQIHNDATAREFLGENFDSHILAAYDKANHPAQKGDLFRLAYLYKMGGYYIDVDDLVFVDLKKYFAGTGSAFFFESIGHLGNNFLATRSGNRVFEDMLIEASENVSTGAFDGCIWRGTGPGLVSRHVARQVHDIVANGRAREVRIALPGEHQKISSYHLELNYKKAGFHWMGENETE